MRKLLFSVTSFRCRDRSYSLWESKKMVCNRNVPFDEKFEMYRRISLTSGEFTALELIDFSILMANTCSITRKNKELSECLLNLRIYCSSLNESSERAIPEKSWNYLIQHFVKDDDFKYTAMHWYKKVMLSKIASPNIFTLKAVLPLFSESGEVDVCQDIMRKLEDLNELHVFFYIHYLNSCIKTNDLERAFSVVLEMKQKGIEPNFGVYIPLLKEATKTKNLQIGMKIYEMIKASSLQSQPLSMSIILFMLQVGRPNIVVKECEYLKRNGLMDVVSWTCLMQAYIQLHDTPGAIALLDEMKRTNVNYDAKTLSVLMTACADSNMFEEGKFVHDLALNNIPDIPIELYNSIINFYNKCGYPQIAVEECEYLKKKGMMNVVSWTCLEQSYILLKDIPKAISLLDEMKRNKVNPNSTTITILLTACADYGLFEQGRGLIKLTNPQNGSTKLHNSILNFYNKCGYPKLAIEEFEKMRQLSNIDVVSYNCVMQSFIQMKETIQALSLLDEMKQFNIQPNTTTFTILMTACADSNFTEQGKFVYQAALENLELFPIELITAVLNFKNKCGSIETLQIESLKRKGMDVAYWTCMIQSSIQGNDIPGAIAMLDEMKLNNVKPNSTTFAILLTACADHGHFDKGKALHSMVLEEIPSISIELATSIINFYNKCGFPEKAIEEFQKMTLINQWKADVILWNCLIQAYIQMSETSKAISLLDEMKRNNIPFDAKTLSILMSACADSKLFEQGKDIHQKALKYFELIPMELMNCILNFYNKCEHPETALEQFERMKNESMLDVVSWTCSMQSYIQMNEPSKAIALLHEMKQNNINPSSTTFTVLISACADLSLFKEGNTLCHLALESIQIIPIELGTAILNFFNKCGKPILAVEECEKMMQRGINHVALWNCLIQSYIILDFNQAITTFYEMKKHVNPDFLTYGILLSGCGEHVAITFGNKIISEINDKWEKLPEDIMSVMVYYYSRIGDNEKAEQVFNNLKEEETKPLSIVTFNNMLSCYAHHGRAVEAKQFFSDFKQNVHPNEQSFVILLGAFSHCGMVEDAITLVKEYIDCFSKEPSLFVSCAMVDVLSRSGKLYEAEVLINGRMDFKLWNTLLGGCRKFNNVELGEKAFKVLINIDEKQPSPYVLMSNIYAYHKMDAKVNIIRLLMIKNGIKKVPSVVCHEYDGKLYKFISGATEYERYKEIENMKMEIYHKIIEAGFTPDTRWVTSSNMMSEQEKLDSLFNHAEKTAIAHALVLNPNIEKIVLKNNLRMCNDCHTAIEFISKVMNVEIIVRDANRYHHFKEGRCTCDRYW